MDHSTVLVCSKDQVVQMLQKQIDEAAWLISSDKRTEEIEAWIASTSRFLTKAFSNGTVSNQFFMITAKSKYEPNQSLQLFQQNVSNGIKYLRTIIEDVEKGFFDPVPGVEWNSVKKRFDHQTFHEIIRRILNNFPKHLEEMYQKDVHGNGTIKKADLDKIKIGNEYDVQRILFSLIRVLFPEARIEVPKDGGYKGYRYDIYLDHYETVIEVKCTHEKMQERHLTEQIGSVCIITSKSLFISLFLIRLSLSRMLMLFAKIIIEKRKMCGVRLSLFSPPIWVEG